MSEQTPNDVEFSLDNLPSSFDRLPEYKFTPEDRKMMAAMLGLKPRTIKKKKVITTYVLPHLGALATEEKRSLVQHELIQASYALKAAKENATESNDKTIDVSEFDDQDFAVLDLINKIIDANRNRRSKAQKKTLNPIVQELELV